MINRFTSRPLRRHLAPPVGESSEAERLEDLHRRRNVLAAFCKLVLHGVLEMSTAAEVFVYYMKVKAQHLKGVQRFCVYISTSCWEEDEKINNRLMAAQ